MTVKEILNIVAKRTLVKIYETNMYNTDDFDQIFYGRAMNIPMVKGGKIMGREVECIEPACQEENLDDTYLVFYLK